MGRARLFLLFLVLLFVIPPAVGLLTTNGGDSLPVILVTVLALLLVIAIVIKSARTERSDDNDAGSWSIIPDWQYEGRFAEAGGLTRSEQSESLKEIQTDAEETKRSQK